MHIQKIDNTGFGAGRVKLQGMKDNEITKKAAKKLENLAYTYNVDLLIDKVGGISMPKNHYMIYANCISGEAKYTGFSTLDKSQIPQNIFEKIFHNGISKTHFSKELVNKVKSAINNLSR